MIQAFLVCTTTNSSINKIDNINSIALDAPEVPDLVHSRVESTTEELTARGLFYSAPTGSENEFSIEI